MRIRAAEAVSANFNGLHGLCFSESRETSSGANAWRKREAGSASVDGPADEFDFGAEQGHCLTSSA